MINLLPSTTKRQLRAARANVLLVRYTVLSAAVVVFLGLGVASVYLVMSATKSNAENTSLENQSQISDYTKVQAEAAEFRTNLSTAKTIMDKEVIYSDTVLSIARIIPSGVVLSNLTLDSTSFGSPITINANATSYQHAVNLKSALEQSDIFTDVHFTSIGDGGSGEQSGKYPYTVVLSATLKQKDAK